MKYEKVLGEQDARQLTLHQAEKQSSQYRFQITIVKEVYGRVET